MVLGLHNASLILATANTNTVRLKRRLRFAVVYPQSHSRLNCRGIDLAFYSKPAVSDIGIQNELRRWVSYIGLEMNIGEAMCLGGSRFGNDKFVAESDRKTESLPQWRLMKRWKLLPLTARR